MKKWSLALICVAVVISLGVSGCATQPYVTKQISDLQQQIQANRAEIAILKNSDAQQNEKLTELSVTVQDAIARVKQLRDIAEVKFLYETIINDDGILFAFGSSELLEETKFALDGFASGLKDENRACYIEIQGHTDNRGPEEYNFQLGLARARAVMSYFYVQHAIPLNRMNTFSYGASKPIADNSVSSKRARNRRVNLVVMTRASPAANAQGEQNNKPEEEYADQENRGEDNHAAEDLTSKSLDKGFLIQVGAYSSLATAENVRKVLQDKGYEVCLAKKTLPELGLIHRVRIRGYTTNVNAEADVEKLKKGIGLSPTVCSMGPG